MIPWPLMRERKLKIKAPLQERFFNAINKSEIIIFFAALASRRLKTWKLFLLFSKKKKRYWELHTWWKMALVRRKIERGWKEDRCLKLEIQTAATRMLILLSLYYFFDDGALKKKTHLNPCVRDIFFNMMVEAIRDESQPLWKLN